MMSPNGGTMLRITSRLSLLLSARRKLGEPPHAHAKVGAMALSPRHHDRNGDRKNQAYSRGAMLSLASKSPPAKGLKETPPLWSGQEPPPTVVVTRVGGSQALTLEAVRSPWLGLPSIPCQPGSCVRPT